MIRVGIVGGTGYTGVELLRLLAVLEDPQSDFDDIGDTTVGKIAFGWRPTEWFMLRGSWSEAFRAPNLITINEALVVRQNTRIDYVCDYVERVTGANLDADCTPSVQRRATGSSTLKPEQSENTNIGIVWNFLAQRFQVGDAAGGKRYAAGKFFSPFSQQ